MIVGVDWATNRWHAIGRAPWMPEPGWRASRWQKKTGNSEELRQPLVESFERFVSACVNWRDIAGQPDEPIHLFVERPLALRNPKTNIALGLTGGALWGQHLHHDVFWWWTEIASWQKMVGVVHGKDKTPVIKGKSRAYAMEHLLLTEDLDEDHYDAANLGLWGERELEKLPGAWRPDAGPATGRS